MERTLQKEAFPFFCAARRTLRGLAFVFLALIAVLPRSASAVLSGAQPVMSVGIYNATGYPVCGAAKLAGVRYTFEAQVDLPVGGPRLKADLYLGMLAHKSDLSLSWTATDNKPALTSGMVPIIKNIDMNVPQSINPATYVQGDFAYAFKGGEPAGLYFVFVMLVTAGRDPGDSKNWLAVRMEPFFVSDMP